MAGEKSKPSEQKLKTEVRTVDPGTLRGRDRNARYMSAKQMQQLVDNIRRDGQLTSLPLVYAHQGGKRDGELEILSGHHRVEAAIKAGFEEIDVLVIVSKLSAERLTAIQLSHNAISGQDDNSILAQLYAELDLAERKYSGLSDDMFSGLDLKLAGLSIAAVKYHDMHISFLPEDAEEFREFLERFGNKAKTREILVARFAEFDAMFDTIIRVKTHLKVTNVGVALCLMAELASERLEQMETEANGPDTEETAPVGNAAGDIEERSPPPVEEAKSSRRRGGSKAERGDPKPRRASARRGAVDDLQIHSEAPEAK